MWKFITIWVYCFKCSSKQVFKLHYYFLQLCLRYPNIVCAKKKKKKGYLKHWSHVDFLICRTDEESNFANPDVDCSPEMPLLNFLDEQHVHTQQPSITNNVEPEHSVLPPSFTDLLTGNSIDIEKGAICKLQICIRIWCLHACFYCCVMFISHHLACNWPRWLGFCSFVCKSKSWKLFFLVNGWR